MRHSMSACRPVPSAGLVSATAGAAGDGETGGFAASAGGAAGDAAGATGLAGASAAVALSRIAITAPSPTLSPTLTFNSLTTPSADDGTSIVALSDSSVTRPWSLRTVSPTATSSSMTGM